VRLATLLAFTLALAPAAVQGETRFVDVRGNKLHVETLGSGPPLLFLHGGVVFFANNFPAQRDYFSSFRKVIGVDRRGHGHSPDNAEPFSYKEMAEDMAALIVQLGVAPVDIVGHSDGGNIGLILARDHPALVRRLVVSGANLKAGLPPEELKKRAQWSKEMVDERVKLMAEKLPPRFRPEYEKVTPHGAEHWWTLLAKSYRLWLTPVIATPDELKTIKIPVLVMAGDQDFTSIEDTTLIYRSLPAGQLAILPGTGHGTFSARPDLANLITREFLERP
jgi:pimeloyl-ACP methyl ester carboxylesterase